MEKTVRELPGRVFLIGFFEAEDRRCIPYHNLILYVLLSIVEKVCRFRTYPAGIHFLLYFKLYNSAVCFPAPEHIRHKIAVFRVFLDQSVFSPGEILHL